MQKRRASGPTGHAERRSVFWIVVIGRGAAPLRCGKSQRVVCAGAALVSSCAPPYCLNRDVPSLRCCFCNGAPTSSWPIQSNGEAPERLVQTLMARAIACLRTDCGRQPAVRTAGCTPDFAAIRAAVTGLCRPHTITPKKNLSAPGSDRHRAPFVIGRVASAVRRGRKPQSFSYLRLLQFAMMRLRLNQQPAECSKSVRVLPIPFRFKGA
jgi:hypothetical protein